MKYVTIKYNPFFVTTEIRVDKQKPRSNSNLNIAKGRRLQEWIDRLPQYLIDDYCDNAYNIVFTGTKTDYEDVLVATKAYSNRVNFKCEHNPTKDIADVEKQIADIFNEIQQRKSVPQLRDEKIIEAFNKAQNSQFVINVIATMSAGKSTLINALLGKKLMPAAQKATTAKIVRIEDTDQENFSAVAYDKDGEIVETFDDVQLEDMKRLNEDEKVKTIVIKGKIRFVKQTNMKLVLVDTPGPNNSLDESHAKMTYSMIDEDKDHSFILLVMNGGQLGVNDEKDLLDNLCKGISENMGEKNKQKQSRDRFLFAVNKVDDYNPEEDGIKEALDGVKDALENRGISDPNIFPVSALAALELRGDLRRRSADKLRKEIIDYDSTSMCLDNYYEYSHLPQSTHEQIDGWLQKVDEDHQLLIHTGIISIEQAINLYINKYARTIKVRHLVDSFINRVKGMNAIGKLQEKVRQDATKKAELEVLIKSLQDKIDKAKEAKTFETKIDELDMSEKVKREIEKYTDEVSTRISKLISTQPQKISKSEAKHSVESLMRQYEDIKAKLEVKINGILKNAYNETLSDVIESYKSYMEELCIDFNASSLGFDPMHFVEDSTNDLDIDSLLYEYSHTEDVQVKTGRKIHHGPKWWNPFSWFDDKWDEDELEWTKDEKVEMRRIAEKKFTPIQLRVAEIRKDAIKHVAYETKRLKLQLKKEVKNIDNHIAQKLKETAGIENQAKQTAAELKQKEEDLKWLEDIQNRVRNLVEF